MIKEIKQISSVRGEIVAPGDKSISHRAIMISSIANGDAHITNFLMGDDCKHTIEAFRELGVDIEVNEDEVVVHGKGLHSLKEPRHITDAGNSGTTARLMFGILAGQPYNSIIDGDESLRQRPMGRVIEPLSLMGAKVLAKRDKYLPANIFGSKLQAITYKMPVASAQVKSALILAGLFAEGTTKIIESVPSRNHTELLLEYLGANIKVENGVIEVDGSREMVARDICIPGDISSASYFIVAGLIIENSKLLIRNVNINDTRCGILKVLDRMGANIKLSNIRKDVEKMADITVESSELCGTTLGGAEIPSLIDELPVIAIAAMTAKGDTIVTGAEELKVKETNRIDTICEMVSALGGSIEARDDGFVVHGVESVTGGFINSKGDHRIAMAGSIGALIGSEPSHIVDAECVDISFPEFYKILERIAK